MDASDSNSGKRRYETFCDAFLAFVLVASALQLRFPATAFDEHMAAASPLWEELAIYALNFFTVAVLWSNQRRLTRTLPSIPPQAVPLMLFVMALLALTPRATAALALDATSKPAIIVYAAIWTGICVLMTLARITLIRIFPDNSDVAALHGMVTYRGVAALLIYAGAIPLCQVSPVAALVALVAAPSLFLVRDEQKAR